ncbi:MAG TPA: hypothetical protein VE218_12540, partial [Acidobacteriaceae bacterium]|nr:hypothetical protein [Acidobacteriaceae bacterium]
MSDQRKGTQQTAPKALLPGRQAPCGILPQMRRCHHIASVLLAALFAITPLAARAIPTPAAQALNRPSGGAAERPATVDLKHEPLRPAVHLQDTGFLNRVIILNGVEITLSTAQQALKQFI